MVVHCLTICHICKQLVRLWYTAGLKEALAYTDGCTTTVTHHFKVKYPNKTVVENPQKPKLQVVENPPPLNYAQVTLSTTVLGTETYIFQMVISSFTTK